MRHLNYRSPFMACYTLDLLKHLEADHRYRKCPNQYSYGRLFWTASGAHVVDIQCTIGPLYTSNIFPQYQKLFDSYLELYLEAKWNTSETMTSMDMGIYPLFFHESGVYAPENLNMAAMAKEQVIISIEPLRTHVPRDGSDWTSLSKFPLFCSPQLRDYSLFQQVWQRLEAPYGTDCWDYVKKFGHNPIFKGNMARTVNSLN